MNIASLRAALDKASISTEDYVINGHWDNRTCIERNSDTGKWETFTFERSKGQIAEFDNEEAACYNLYARLVSSYVIGQVLAPAEKDGSA